MQRPARSIAMRLLVNDDASKSVSGGSPGNTNLSESPTGNLDAASGPTCYLPGIWAIMNRYDSVFSFRFWSLLFCISASDISFRMFNRALWSVTTVKYLHPSTKQKH